MHTHACTLAHTPVCVKRSAHIAVPPDLTRCCRCAQVDPRGKAWNRLRASIGQPNFMADQ